MGVDPPVVKHVDRVLCSGIHSIGSNLFRGTSLALFIFYFVPYLSTVHLSISRESSRPVGPLSVSRLRTLHRHDTADNCKASLFAFVPTGVNTENTTAGHKNGPTKTAVTSDKTVMNFCFLLF